LENIVIIPTYNERENIGHLIDVIFAQYDHFHILVIDDGSPDNTATLVKDRQVKYAGKLFLEERKGKLGLGTAYIHGFKWALKKGYRYIFEMDADFRIIPKTCNACTKPARTAALM
jgi:dolichol-phosphate mannosyltransferase